MLIGVLLLHRQPRHPHVIAGIRTAFEARSAVPDMVVAETYKHAAEACGTATAEPSQPRSKVSLRPDILTQVVWRPSIRRVLSNPRSHRIFHTERCGRSLIPTVHDDEEQAS
ncbi:hypothetical protein [Amycolatopsis sp. NPDC004079]|uniref:hypothetical protein n=1 Tax=Amycolatopsis sp. NPDC004079 TaxID=3154549 RepID=UPI0033BF1FB1